MEDEKKPKWSSLALKAINLSAEWQSQPALFEFWFNLECTEVTVEEEWYAFKEIGDLSHFYRVKDLIALKIAGVLGFFSYFSFEL